MSKNCIVTTVKGKIKGKATSYIEKESEIFIPVSKKFSLNQTRAMAQDKVNSINKEYLSEKFGNVVSLNTSYTDGTGINIHPSQLLIDAYEVKEGNKTIEEINSKRNLEYFNGDQDLLTQDEDDRDLKIQKEIDSIVEDTNKIEEKTDTYFSITPEVNYNLKASEILFSQRADEIFRKGDKNNWSLDKILTELQIPKEQKQLLLDLNITNREQLALELASNYSYSVEINTSTENGLGVQERYNPETGDIDIDNIEPDFDYIEEYDEDGNIIGMTPVLTEKGKKQLEEKPTQYYSNLTVNEEFYKNNPDWEYKEQRITTPLITPSIKGHAQFAQDNDIGWFRAWYNKKTGEVHVLEVQSDLFQKGRDKENLTATLQNKGDNFVLNGVVYDTNIKDFKTGEKTYTKRNENFGWDKITEEEYNIAKNKLNKDNKENQFLQLLNKDSNWVTFFVKSIIQSTAKQTITEVQQEDVEAKVRELENSGLLKIKCD